MFGAENLHLKPYSLQKNLFHCIHVLQCYVHIGFAFASLGVQSKQTSFAFKSLLLISNLYTGCFSTALNCFKSQQWFSLNVLQRQHCCLTSIHISFNCFLCMCLLYGTLFACFVALFYKDFLMALWGNLAFIVECFIWIHVHCIMCFTEVFGLHSVFFFYHLMFTFSHTPGAFVIQTLNCGVQARVERGRVYSYKL